MGGPVGDGPAGPWSEPPEWFEPYFRERYQHLLAVALGLGGARHLLEAEDAVQSVMVRQVASGRWEHIEHPHGFFCRAVIRAVLMIHRSRNSRREQALTDDSDNVSGAGAGDGLTVWENTEWVLGLLNALPAQQRKVMALTLDGLTGAEIAQRLGASEATVRSNLRHARDRLAKLLTEDEAAGRRREGEL